MSGIVQYQILNELPKAKSGEDLYKKMLTLEVIEARGEAVIEEHTGPGAFDRQVGKLLFSLGGHISEVEKKVLTLATAGKGAQKECSIVGGGSTN